MDDLFDDDGLFDEADFDDRFLYELNDIGLVLRMQDAGLIPAVGLHRS